MREGGANSPGLIVHAGNRKTGSTAIQDYLLEHETGSSYEYLYRGKANSSLWMVQAFKHDLEKQPFVARGASLREIVTSTGVDLPARAGRIRRRAREALEKRIRAMRKPLGILSAENIYSMNEAEVEELHAVLASLVPQIDVLIYLRTPKGQIESGFQERLKHGATDLRRRYRLNHARRLQTFDRIFGRERVHVYKYAREEFPGGDAAAHFMGCLGLEYHASKARRANTGLSLPATQLLYIYRMYYPEQEPVDRRVVSQLTGLPGGRLHFHSSLYGKIHSPDPEAVRSLQDRVGFSLLEDVTAHDGEGIRSEDDLLALPGSAVDWLREKVGTAGGGDELRAVAESVRALGKLKA